MMAQELNTNFERQPEWIPALRWRAGIVLEGRDLKKNYGSGAKNLAVLVDANIILRARRDDCDRGPIRRG